MKKITILRPYEKVLFPVPARITFAERIKKNLMYLAIQLFVAICFSVKADPFLRFYPVLRFASMIEIHFT